MKTALYTPGLPSASFLASLPKELDVEAIGDARDPKKPADVEVLAAFSAGGHRVAGLLARGVVQPRAIALADATHYRTERQLAIARRYGGQTMPLAPWLALFERAMCDEGPHVFVSHTYLTYTSEITDDPRTAQIEMPYESTVATLRRCTGLALDEPGPGGSAVTRVGRLQIHSYESGPADAPAHGRQLTEVLPRLLSACVAAVAPPRQSVGVFFAGSEEAWAKMTRRDRLLAWIGGEIQSGVKEAPLGSNDSPRIKEYRTGITYYRRDAKGKEVKMPTLPPSAWCVMAIMYGLEATRVEGDKPIVARVSGVELLDDARRNGTFRDPKSYTARPGDLAIVERGTPTDGLTHTTAVQHDDGPSGRTIHTVGGNEGAGNWSPLTTVERDRSEVLGFVALD